MSRCVVNRAWFWFRRTFRLPHAKSKYVIRATPMYNPPVFSFFFCTETSVAAADFSRQFGQHCASCVSRRNGTTMCLPQCFRRAMHSVDEKYRSSICHAMRLHRYSCAVCRALVHVHSWLRAQVTTKQRTFPVNDASTHARITSAKPNHLCAHSTISLDVMEEREKQQYFRIRLLMSACAVSAQRVHFLLALLATTLCSVQVPSLSSTASSLFLPRSRGVAANRTSRHRLNENNLGHHTLWPHTLCIVEDGLCASGRNRWRNEVARLMA